MVSDKVCVLLHFTVLVFFQLKDESDVVVAIARSYVQVEMKNRLPGNAAVVGEEVESFQVQSFDKRSGNNSSSAQERSITARFQLKEITVMRFRDDQCVAEMDRVDIEDRHDVLVFEQHHRSNIAGNDPTEDTIAHNVLHTSEKEWCKIYSNFDGKSK
jgi:hypothetical protein